MARSEPPEGLPHSARKASGRRFFLYSPHEPVSSGYTAGNGLRGRQPERIDHARETGVLRCYCHRLGNLRRRFPVPYAAPDYWRFPPDRVFDTERPVPPSRDSTGIILSEEQDWG